jgi:predicted DNA-binding transcriptional regulator AlpA
MRTRKPKPSPLLVSMAPACAQVGISPHQAERLGKVGAFPKAVRLGGRRYLRRAEFEAWNVDRRGIVDRLGLGSAFNN